MKIGETSLSDTERHRIVYLEVLADYQRQHDGNAPYLSDLFSDLEAEDTARWSGIVRGLEADGLIRLHRGFDPASTSGDLTDAGRSFLDEVLVARKDPVRRKSAATNGLLLWLYENDAYGESFLRIEDAAKSTHGFLLGERLPEGLFRAAAERLSKLGLVTPSVYVAEFPDGPLQVKLTDEGQELVESGRTLELYMQEQRRERPTNVTHFHAPVTNSNIAWASEKVDQAVQVTSSGLAADELLLLVRALREAAPVLGLDEVGHRELAASTEALEGELVRPEPDKGIVQTYMQRATNAVVSAAGSQLGLLLSTHVKMVMAGLGIPIE
jgi:hypothetical protein